MGNQTILMADDDADDRFLVQAAFEDNAINHNILFFEDGEQLLDHLGSLTSSLKSTRFILLDLNMPKRDGRDVLRVLKNHQEFSTIPIIVFSTSKAPDDINSSYKLGANSYVVKPSSYEHLKEVIKKISDFWLNTAMTPY